MPVSGEFSLVDFNKIKVEDRIRKDYKGVDELADSISRHGMLHPLVITRDFRLVTGGRRYEAYKKLHKDLIPVQFIDQISPYELQVVELEENVRRKDLTWQEDAEGHLLYHEARCKVDADWNVEMTADSLGTSERTVSRRLVVARVLRQGNEKVAGCETLSAAFNILDRERSRDIDTELASFGHAEEEDPAAILPDVEIPLEIGDDGQPKLGSQAKPYFRPSKVEVNLIVEEEDFLKWAPEYSGIPFNFIHCDFPYGVQHHKSEQGGTAKWGGYEDTPEIYFQLLDAMLLHRDKLIAPSAHLMFWFSMNFYSETVERFQSAGFQVNPFPLIWFKSDNTGILPDPERGPRRVYETALLISRGDRRVVRSVSNVCACPANKKDAAHVSEKPIKMLEHFFKMFVDSSSVVLDPTCGSGTALAVAERFKAKRTFGLESICQNAILARTTIQNYRKSLYGKVLEDA